ncbi:MAG: MFS transporter, partial [Phyllobacterium sp.]
DIGLAVLSTGVFQLLAIPVYALLANRFDLRWILMFGLSLFALSMWDFSPITHDWGAKELLLPQAIRGFAQQMAVPPVVTLTLGALAPDRLKLASGLFNLMRNLGGAVGLAVINQILTDRGALHYAQLSEHVRWGNPEADDLMASMSSNFTTRGLDGPAAALARMSAMVHQQASLLSFMDVFYILTVLFASLAVFAVMMRKPGAPAGGGGH